MTARAVAGPAAARAVAGLAAAVAVFIGAAYFAGLAHAEVPAPAGEHLVGRTDTTVSAGGRELPVSVWYPAAAPTIPAHYVPASNPVAAALLSTEAALWLGEPIAAPMMLTATVAAGQDAPLDTTLGPLPVVVYSPGLGTPRWLASGLAADLASRGYVVIGVDHPGETPAVEVHGELMLGTAPAYEDTEYMRRALDIRVADVHLVLDELAALPVVGGHVDIDRIAVVGHSYGGLTALAAMRAEPRVRVAVVLDGPAGWADNTDIERGGVDRPVLMLASGDMLHASWIRFASDNPAFTLGTIRGAGHYTATDLPALAPSIARCGSLPAERAAAITRSVVTGFLDEQLRDAGAAAPLPSWPELEWRTR
ncbi:alpha/beta hydrolase [Nocardia sp. R6R-6]|uniref:alpha/beta hydrolase n=1 Tax=Nocardia sp. R6R-6 TaxID=3459303 RepID=UPI00403DB5AA